MSKTGYNSRAKLLVELIDIAVDSFTNDPPKEFEADHIKQFVSVYLDQKNKIIDPKPEFQNLTSLKYIESDILTYFQESSGKAVDAFWKQVESRKLGIKRVNRFERILKRGKIRDDIEYDVITDLNNSYVEMEILSEKDIMKINDVIRNFEIK